MNSAKQDYKDAPNDLFKPNVWKKIMKEIIIVYSVSRQAVTFVDAMNLFVWNEKMYATHSKRGKPQYYTHSVSND